MLLIPVLVARLLAGIRLNLLDLLEILAMVVMVACLVSLMLIG